MSRKLIFSLDEYYHVYNRGTGKVAIFLDDYDRKRFQKLLYICNGDKPVVYKTVQNIPLEKVDKGQSLVAIGSYCLMPNHFHLLLKEKNENGISLFMGKLLTAYSMYFNKKYERKGTLFEGPFQAIIVNEDNYLKYLFSYIHLNPIKIIDSSWKESGIKDYNLSKKYLSNYEYSSYLDYMGVNREISRIIDRALFPEYFVDKKDFEEYIDDWLLYKESDGKL